MKRLWIDFMDKTVSDNGTLLFVVNVIISPDFTGAKSKIFLFLSKNVRRNMAMACGFFEVNRTKYPILDVELYSLFSMRCFQ